MGKSAHLAKINIAPHPQRVVPMVWVLLCCAVVAAIVSAYELQLSMQQLQVAREEFQALQAQQEKLRKDLRKKARSQNSTSNAASIAALQRVKAITGLSWDGLLDSLELAAKTARGGVSIVSLVPADVSAPMPHINIVAQASGPQVMLFYMEQLQKDARIALLELKSQQPEDSISPTALRFSLLLTWNPAVSMPEPVSGTGNTSVQTGKSSS